MQIRVSTGNCRVAVGAAIVQIDKRIEDFKAKARSEGFQQLRDGAVHNGLDVTPAREQEMREMVERDIEHMLGQHPAGDTLAVLKNFVDMLAYHTGSDIVIDDQDFHLLKEHLPTSSLSEELSKNHHTGDDNDRVQELLAHAPL